MDENTEQPAPTTVLLSLPKLPPLTPEVRRLRQEGVYVHHIRFDTEAAEQERQASVAGLARLPSKRAVGWYWRACAMAGYHEGMQVLSEATLRHELDRADEFTRWTDFEREAVGQPLAELHAHADFRVHHQVQRRGGKVVAVRFTLQKPPDENGVEARSGTVP